MYITLTRTSYQCSCSPNLVDWKAWSVWGDNAQLESPTSIDGKSQPLKFWPSKIQLEASDNGLEFQQTVKVFSASWVPLPGDAAHWPLEVSASGASRPVLPQGSRPSIWLEPGTYTISGQILWAKMPQKLSLPSETGLVSLVVQEQPIDQPLWDNGGHLWLNKSSAPQENTGEDSLSANLYGYLEDGIPLKFRLRLELIVSGKSREEDLGTILPKGWVVSAITSPLPTALESNGNLLVQVRPGRWDIDVETFHLQSTDSIHFSSAGANRYQTMLLGFKARPEFRTVELGGIAPVDVSMTTFPENWRGIPVYQWNLEKPARLVEKMRGMDEKALTSISLQKEWWLDSSGSEWIFLDNLNANMQRAWRLNVDPRLELGSVRLGGNGQLITKDPQSGQVGVELREQNVALQATGRIPQTDSYPASGWLVGVDKLNFTLNLPPGWRLLALFGGDWVRGDWLTSWSLLDIFVVLLIALAIARAWGLATSLLTLTAIILTFKEPGAPQYLWLALIFPLAICRFTNGGKFRTPLLIWKWATASVFLLVCLPFFWNQIQQSIYPQLETPGHIYAPAQPRDTDNLQFPGPAPTAGTAMQSAALVEGAADHEQMQAGESEAGYRSKAAFSSLVSSAPAVGGYSAALRKNTNLTFDPKAKIQTGPGIPSWRWRQASFGWSGPITQNQDFTPILIPPTITRLLALGGVLTILASFCLLVGVPKTLGRARRMGLFSMLILCISLPSASLAQYPSQELLGTLRQRILEVNAPADVAANIPQVSATISGNKLSVAAEIHVARLAAVTLPGQLPAWSPSALPSMEKRQPSCETRGIFGLHCQKEFTM